MIELTVPDMSCGHCVAAITRAIKELDADAKVTITLADKRVAVESAEDRAAIEACLQEAGYPVAPAGT